MRAGDVIDGKYRVVRVLGEGSMGVVYEGHNLRIDRRIAIKIMHASIARDTRLVARFEREAQAAAKIGSAHIIDVLDLGDLPGGHRYMIMEFLEGETLQQRLATAGTLSPREAAPIALQILDGLAMVHVADIVHRDLKPANIFLVTTASGPPFVKILDFGVCKDLSLSGGEGGELTGFGTLLGTLAYMAPEQLEHGSKRLDGRSDLYSLGVMLFRAVAGRLPYEAKSIPALFAQMRGGHAPNFRELVPGVDPAFAAIIERAIHWDPNARFATAPEFREALLAWDRGIERVDSLLSGFLDKPPTSPEPWKPSRGSGASRITARVPSEAPSNSAVITSSRGPATERDEVDIPVHFDEPSQKG
jgi:serine/threonine-protein kinase